MDLCKRRINARLYIGCQAVQAIAIMLMQFLDINLLVMINGVGSLKCMSVRTVYLMVLQVLNGRIFGAQHELPGGQRLKTDG